MTVSLAFGAQPMPWWRWGGSSVPVFRHHGLLAPGVWVMRRLSLPQKALLALLAVVVPLLPLHVQELRELHASGVRLQAEDSGLRLLAEAEHLIQSAESHRPDGGGIERIQTLARRMKDKGVDASQQVSGLQAAITGMLLKERPAGGADARLDALRAQTELLRLVVDGGDLSGSTRAMYQMLGLYRQLQELLTVPMAAQPRLALLNKLLDTVRAQQAQASRRWNKLAVAWSMTLVLGGYLILSAFRVLKGGLTQVTACVQRIKGGDLSQAPHALGRDELGRIIDDLGLASQKMADLLASAGLGVQAVSHASQQVAAGNSDLAVRNRASTDKVASVVEGVGHCTRQLEACRAEVQQVVNSIDALMRESARSRHQMGKLVENMRVLNGRSNEIGDIVSLMDGIAFRTNVLALNASVEANKAGELGKGFAVVAHEVRSLALKAAQSAQRIGGVVHASMEDIGLSTALAQEADTQLGRMDAHVDLIKQASAHVATMTRESEAESENILEELRHIKGGMDQNLALVNQLKAASGALSMQSERLQIKLAQFKLT